MKAEILILTSLFLSGAVFGQINDPSTKANYERAKAVVAAQQKADADAKKLYEAQNLVKKLQEKKSLLKTGILKKEAFIAKQSGNGLGADKNYKRLSAEKALLEDKLKETINALTDAEAALKAIQTAQVPVQTPKK